MPNPPPPESLEQVLRGPRDPPQIYGQQLPAGENGGSSQQADLDTCQTAGCEQRGGQTPAPEPGRHRPPSAGPPCSQEGAGQGELSLVTSAGTDSESWSHSPRCGTQLAPPTVVLLWANDRAPLSLGFHICQMETPLHVVGFSPPSLTPRVTGAGAGVQGLLTSAAASLPGPPGSPDEGQGWLGVRSGHALAPPWPLCPCPLGPFHPRPSQRLRGNPETPKACYLWVDRTEHKSSMALPLLFGVLVYRQIAGTLSKHLRSRCSHQRFHQQGGLHTLVITGN